MFFPNYLLLTFLNAGLLFWVFFFFLTLGGFMYIDLSIYGTFWNLIILV